MNKVKSFFRKAFDKTCFCLFLVFFILTYPLYKKAKMEIDAAASDKKNS